MNSLPAEVADDETIVRVVKSPQHLNGSKRALRKSAFQPRRGSAEFSVVRQAAGDDFCKDKGVEMIAPLSGADYYGLAVGLAGTIREIGGDVIDKPDDFAGHAHVVNVMAEPPVEEPLPPEEREKLDEYYKKLLAHFIYHPDPKPTESGWTGPPLSWTATS